MTQLCAWRPARSPVNRARNRFSMPFIAKDRWPLVLWLISIVLGLAAVAAVLRHVGMRHLERSAEVTASTTPRCWPPPCRACPICCSAGGRTSPRSSNCATCAVRARCFASSCSRRTAGRSLVSDDLDKPAAGLAPNGAMLGDEHGARSAKVSAIVLSGGSFIELKDGTGKKDRPPVFTEAYVPLVRDGQVMGVVEVYLDHTALQQQVDGDVCHRGDRRHAGVRCARRHRHRALDGAAARAAPRRGARALPRAARRAQRRAQPRQPQRRAAARGLDRRRRRRGFRGAVRRP